MKLNDTLLLVGKLTIVLAMVLGMFIPLVSADMAMKTTAGDTVVDGTFAAIYSNRAAKATYDVNTLDLTDLSTDASISSVFLVLFLVCVIGLVYGSTRQLLDSKLPLSFLAATLGWISGVLLLLIANLNITTLLNETTKTSDGYLIDSTSTHNFYVSATRGISFYILAIGLVLYLIAVLMPKSKDAMSETEPVSN